ncbi:MAG: class I SAM-dependent methyltransferase, partial [Actinobacteria bacterium]|nr:class I SAM-dependent methyltransferase [Actinomycetota bacterium]
MRTRDRVYLDDLGLAAEDRLWHAPSDWLAVRDVIGRLGVTRDDVFVDYGSGLGRVVLAAASFPFGRVIGVELSAELTARAHRNVDAARSRIRADTVDLVTADARDWHPPADLTVAYLYSPFLGDTFDAVVQRLFASVDETPRALRI